MTLAHEHPNPLAVLDAVIADLRASGDTGHVENLLQAGEGLIELIGLARMVIRSDAAHQWGGSRRSIVEYAQLCLDHTGSAP
jgi:hypothetical protein